MVAEQPQTWHYGLIASYWAQFNDDFRPHEIPYFQRYIEDDGQPALDVACGTGRLLLPYLRAGLARERLDERPVLGEQVVARERRRLVLGAEVRARVSSIGHRVRTA